MESVEAGPIFIILGFVTGILGFALTVITETLETWSLAGGTVYYTYQPHVATGIIFIGVAAGWILSGIILASIERDIDEIGGLAVFFLGLLGLILWGVFSEEKTIYVQTKSEENYDHEYYPGSESQYVRCSKCGENVSMSGRKYKWCPHCGAKLETTIHHVAPS